MAVKVSCLTKAHAFSRGMHTLFCAVYGKFVVQIPPFEGSPRIFRSILLSVIVSKTTVMFDINGQSADKKGPYDNVFENMQLITIHVQSLSQISVIYH